MGGERLMGSTGLERNGRTWAELSRARALRNAEILVARRQTTRCWAYGSWRH